MEKEPRGETKFKVNDRVKAWYQGKWWSGTVVRFRPRPIKVLRGIFEALNKISGNSLKIIDEDEQYVTYGHPNLRLMDIRTDEKVDDEQDSLFEGFGLTGSPKGPFTIFENEPEPDTGDPIFRNRQEKPVLVDQLGQMAYQKSTKNVYPESLH